MLLLAPGFFAWGIVDAAPETRNKEADAPRRLEWCSAIEVLSPQKSRFPQLRRFSAAQILDLEIRVLLPEKLTGEHRLDVSLYTPDHQLYQTLTVPFRGPGTRATLSQLEEEAHRPSTADRRGRGSSYPRGQAPPHGSQRGPAGGGHLHRHQLSLRGVDGDGVSGRKPEVLRRRSAVHDHRIAVARLPRITFPGSSALSPLSKTTTPFTSTASNPSAYWWGSANVAFSDPRGVEDDDIREESFGEPAPPRKAESLRGKARHLPDGLFEGHDFFLAHVLSQHPGESAIGRTS
jgi:hypothetical protein